MENLIVASLIFIIVGLAIVKIISDRKNGAICSSCPYAKTNALSYQSESIQSKKQNH